MHVPRVEHMYWAKTVPRALYDLSVSGVPTPSPDEYGAQPEDLSAEQLGPYGHPALIEAIARRYGVKEECVVPVPGTSMGNYLALVATVEPGDTVLLESPNYECIRRTVEFFGGRVELFDRNESLRYAPDSEAVERGLRRGARAVFLTDLHNPSGTRLLEDHLEALAELTDRYGAALIIDEVYLEYVHVNKGGPLRTAATLAPHVVATGSLTKVYGLGGLRAGWLIAAPDNAERVRCAMDHLTVNNASPSMNLAIRALRNIERLQARTRRMYEQGWPVAREWLAARPDLTHPGNDGAIFVFARLPGEIDAQRLVDLLVKEYDTLVVPGRFFDRPHHIRMSFCLPPDPLREALSRLGRAIDEMRKTDATTK